MHAALTGYRYRMSWHATGYTVILNASNPTSLLGQLARYERKGARAHFLGTCAPIPVAPKSKLPREVF